MPDAPSLDPIASLSAALADLEDVADVLHRLCRDATPAADCLAELHELHQVRLRIQTLASRSKLVEALTAPWVIGMLGDVDMLVRILDSWVDPGSDQVDVRAREASLPRAREALWVRQRFLDNWACVSTALDRGSAALDAPPRPKRGRPPRETGKRDKDIYDAALLLRGSQHKCENLARQFNISIRDVKLALDRHRNKLARAAKKGRTNSSGESCQGQ